MPYVLILAGIVALISGVRGSSGELVTLLEGDLTGEHNYFYWLVSILIIGALGYIDDLRSLSRAFLVLVLVGLILNEQSKGRGGFFAQFQTGLQEITKG